MRILGIDPGLQVCGYAVVDVDGYAEKLVEAGVLRIDTGRELEKRLNQIADDIGSILESFGPDVLAIEELYSHYAHPKTAILMGHARGVILQKAGAAGLKVKHFSATRIKKSLTGNGRASKEQMQRSIQTMLGLSEAPEPNDVADAIAAALCCANTIGSLNESSG
ncbi:MAG: crossover junction endodeoxyribonuclease RuvC [Planctomycetes bacterium]|nr:crossover junction endodeoxyribonuclease RuvC [Planctomycetota bacterium]